VIFDLIARRTAHDHGTGTANVREDRLDRPYEMRWPPTRFMTVNPVSPVFRDEKDRLIRPLGRARGDGLGCGLVSGMRCSRPGFPRGAG
jgi:hypothetical protein